MHDDNNNTQKHGDDDVHTNDAIDTDNSIQQVTGMNKNGEPSNGVETNRTMKRKNRLPLATADTYPRERGEGTIVEYATFTGTHPQEGGEATIVHTEVHHHEQYNHQ